MLDTLPGTWSEVQTPVTLAPAIHMQQGLSHWLAADLKLPTIKEKSVILTS